MYSECLQNRFVSLQANNDVKHEENVEDIIRRVGNIPICIVGFIPDVLVTRLYAQ